MNGNNGAGIQIYESGNVVLEYNEIHNSGSGIFVKVIGTHFDVSRIAVMKHLDILERANLVISEKQGRTRRLYFNAAPIQMIYDRWTSELSGYWAEQMTRIKYLAETRHSRQSGDMAQTKVRK